MRSTAPCWKSSSRPSSWLAFGRADGAAVLGDLSLLQGPLLLPLRRSAPHRLEAALPLLRARVRPGRESPPRGVIPRLDPPATAAAAATRSPGQPFWAGSLRADPACCHNAAWFG